MLESTPRRSSNTVTRSNGNTDPPTVTTVYTNNLEWTDYREGEENPRFRQQVARCEDATTTFSGSRTSVEAYGSLSSKWKFPLSDTPQLYPTRSYSIEGCPIGLNYGSLAVGQSSIANNAALRSFYNAARAAQTSLTGLSFLGELAETIHMIRRPGESLRKGLEDYLASVKKLKRLPQGSRRKALASTYLEYAFGWMPLLSDMKGASEALSKLMNQPKTQHIRGFGENPNHKSIAVAVDEPIFTNTRVDYSIFDTSNIQYIYRGAVKVTGSGPTLDHAADLFGFRLDEFVPATWELLPWSFLIDYFSNVGDIISATFYASGDLNWVCQTIRTEKTRQCVGSANQMPQQAIDNPGNFEGASGKFGYKVSQTTVERSSVVPGIPTLQLSLPGRNSQWTNIGALFLQSKSLLPFF